MEEGPSSTPPPPTPQTQQASSAITHQDNAKSSQQQPSEPSEPPPPESSAAQHVHHPHHYHHQSHSVRASFKRSQQAIEAEAVKPQPTSSGHIQSGAEGSDVVLVVEADVGEEKKEEAETSLTTLPVPLSSSNQELVSGSGAGPSRTSDTPTHGGRLKEPLIEIPPTNGHPTPQQRGSKACCFCWCCCCSCSWKDTRCLTVKNNEENNARTMMSAAPASAKDNNILDILNGDNNEPSPTIEDIRMWGESFDKLMKCKAGRKVFRDFLRCEYSEENILFWLACEDIKRERNPEAMEEKARLIYEDYISILSPKEVSLDSRVREIVNSNMLKPSCHTFDEAQLQIYTLMHRDSYPRFVNSPIYKKLAQYNTSSRKESSA